MSSLLLPSQCGIKQRKQAKYNLFTSFKVWLHGSLRLILVILLFTTIILNSVDESAANKVEEEFSEELLIKPLPDRKVLSHFYFHTKSPPSLSYAPHHRFFPKSICQLFKFSCQRHCGFVVQVQHQRQNVNASSNNSSTSEDPWRLRFEAGPSGENAYLTHQSYFGRHLDSIADAIFAQSEQRGRMGFGAESSGAGRQNALGDNSEIGTAIFSQSEERWRMDPGAKSSGAGRWNALGNNFESGTAILSQIEEQRRMDIGAESSEAEHQNALEYNSESGTATQEPEVQHVSVQGVGRTLGGNTAPVSDPSLTDPSLSSAPTPFVGLVVDQNLPSTLIQIRLTDGTRIVNRFNYHHTIGEIRGFIDASRPGGNRTYELLAMDVPPKPLTDQSQTIEQAGLASWVVIQKN